MKGIDLILDISEDVTKLLIVHIMYIIFNGGYLFKGKTLEIAIYLTLSIILYHAFIMPAIIKLNNLFINKD